MPRLYYRANEHDGGAGAESIRFGIGYGRHHGVYWEAEMLKTDATLRQEVCQFVFRRYQVQVSN